MTGTLFILLQKAKRFYDSKWTNNPYITRKEDIKQYKQIYTGDIFAIAHGYGRMINITWITMFYGVGMPILFPISCAAFIVMYVVENYCLYYVYIKPDINDDSINQTALKIFEIAPLFLFSIWYMLYSQVYLQIDGK